MFQGTCTIALKSNKKPAKTKCSMFTTHSYNSPNKSHFNTTHDNNDWLHASHSCALEVYAVYFRNATTQYIYRVYINLWYIREIEFAVDLFDVFLASLIRRKENTHIFNYNKINTA